MLACIKSKLNLVKTLLDFDADLDLKDKHGYTAINYAKNNKSLIELLNSFAKVKKLTSKKTRSMYLSFKTLSSVKLKTAFEENEINHKELVKEKRSFSHDDLRSVNANVENVKLFARTGSLASLSLISFNKIV